MRQIALNLFNHTLLGSGDLFTARDCLRMVEETGVDGVTIARGAIGNPWVFRDCLALAAGEAASARPSLAEQRRVIALHLDEAVRHYGARLGAKVMRRACSKYAKLHPRPGSVRAAVLATRSPEELLAVLDEHYGAAAGSEEATPIDRSA